MSLRASHVDGISRRHHVGESECPHRCLCHSPSKKTVAELVNAHVEHPWSHHGVYVLRCQKRPLSAAKRIALDELTSSDGSRIRRPPGWVTAAANADSLLYVGLSKRMVARIHNHAHGTGANFTQVFPPMEILNIDWYPTLWESYYREPQKARQLRRDFPNAYVSQPG